MLHGHPHRAKQKPNPDAIVVAPHSGDNYRQRGTNDDSGAPLSPLAATQCQCHGGRERERRKTGGGNSGSLRPGVSVIKKRLTPQTVPLW